MNCVVIGSTQSTYLVLSELRKISWVNIYCLGILGKHRESDFTFELKRFCSLNNIEYLESNNVNSDESLRFCFDKQPNLVFAVGLSQILREGYFKDSIPKIGFHPTVLPQGRGRAPVAWMIRDQSLQPGYTFFQIDGEVDSGYVIFQQLLNRELFIDAFEYVECIMRDISLNFIERILPKILNPSEWQIQKGEPSYLPVLSERDGELKFSNTIEVNLCIVRATTRPNPGAWLIINDVKYRIWSATENIDTLELATGVVTIDCVDGLIYSDNYTKE